MRRAVWHWLLVTVVVGLPVSVLVGDVAGAGQAAPTVHLGSTTLTPGTTIVITGAGWSPGTALSAVLCGADAVDGLADCAPTTTDTMVATAHGLIWSELSPQLPPQPCPCVVWVTGNTTNLTRTIPVTVVGAPSAPVRHVTRRPVITISNVRVEGHSTVDTMLGASAQRTLEFTITNSGRAAAAPILLARWGSGSSLTNVIGMPAIGTVAPGQSKAVRAPFRIGAFSVGSYDVKVTEQTTGSTKAVTVFTKTTQWPVGLFLVVAVVLICFVYMLSLLRRRPGGRKETKDVPVAAADAVGSGSESVLVGAALTAVPAPPGPIRRLP